MKLLSILIIIIIFIMAWNDLGFNNQLQRPVPTASNELSEDVADFYSPTTFSSSLVTSKDKSLQIDLENNKITKSDGRRIRELQPPVDLIVAVDGTGDFSDIQEAIDYGNQIGGATIFIKSGTYRPIKQIELYSNVYLVGQDSVNTIIDFSTASLNGEAIKAVGDYRDSFDETMSFTYNSSTVTSSSGDFITGGLQAGDRINSPVGTYKIASIISASSLTLSEVYRGNSVTDQINCRVMVGDGIKNVFVSGLTIRGGSFSTTGYVLNISHAVGIVADNLTISDWSVQDTSSGDASAAILIGDTVNYKVTNNIVTDFNKVSGVGVLYGILTDLYAVSGIVQGNYIIATSQHGVGILGSNNKITHNYIASCGGSGIYILADNNIIEGNTAITNGGDGTSGGGVALFSANNVVTGNQLLDNNNDGVYLQNADHNVIAGNNIEDNDGYGINIDTGADNTIISGNKLVSNTSGKVSDSGTGTIRDFKFRAQVRKSANQTISTGSITSITWNTEEFDLGSLHSTASNTDRLTVPEDGLYMINLYVTWEANGTGDRVIYITKNGTSRWSQAHHSSTAGFNPDGQQLSAIEYLSKDDYVSAKCFQNSGGNLDVEGGGNESKFSITHIS